ncbi:MAG TPA: hypothetical protein VFQ53_00755 [Kofleriaceae bacterium]|nr:hypothetical protein [Kofleriaceae bacterium]
MAVAIEVQERRRWAPRTVAAIAAMLVLVTGVLSMRHAALVRHVRDPHSGAFVHAQALAEHHQQASSSHLHGRAVQHDDDGVGPCSLLATVQGTTATRSAPDRVVELAATLDPVPPPALAIAAIAGYRLAPKTSPPAHS